MRLVSDFKVGHQLAELSAGVRLEAGHRLAELSDILSLTND